MADVDDEGCAVDDDADDEDDVAEPDAEVDVDDDGMADCCDVVAGDWTSASGGASIAVAAGDDSSAPCFVASASGDD